MANYVAKTRSVRLFAETDARLLAFAREHRLSPSAALRELVEIGLSRAGLPGKLSGVERARREASLQVKTEVRQAVASALNGIWKKK